MNPQVVFVTGKGGVGKSTVAACLAYKAAQAGERVLLVEIGDQSFYKDYFNLPQVGFEPTLLRENLSVALWSGQACLREYIIYLVKVAALYNLFFENKVMRAFVNIAPGLPELAIMGKATSGPRHHGPRLPFDKIVVDAFSTGHFMALMKAPVGMAEAVKFGPMGEQSRGIDRTLRDPRICEYWIVTLPEELPVIETEELHRDLKKEFGVDARILVNRVFEPELSPDQFKAAQASSSADFRDFAVSYEHHQKQHQDFKKRLSRAARDVHSLPQMWETDVWTLLETLTKDLP